MSIQRKQKNKECERSLFNYNQSIEESKLTITRMKNV